MIDRLERAGHLVRRPDPGDRRRIVLDMPATALADASAFFEPLSVALEEVMDRYGDEQLSLIADFLQAAVQATTDTARVAEEHLSTPPSPDSRAKSRRRHPA